MVSTKFRLLFVTSKIINYARMCQALKLSAHVPHTKHAYLPRSRHMIIPHVLNSRALLLLLYFIILPLKPTSLVAHVVAPQVQLP